MGTVLCACPVLSVSGLYLAETGDQPSRRQEDRRQEDRRQESRLIDLTW